MSNKYLVLVLSSITAALVVLAVVWPVTAERNQAVDRAIVRDFNQISSLVETYYSKEGRIPRDLADLDLGSDIRNRARQNKYSIDRESSRSYQLCAYFKTDTTKNEGSYDYISYEPIRGHKAGLDCLDYEVYTYYYNDTFQSSPSFPDSQPTIDIESYEL